MGIAMGRLEDRYGWLTMVPDAGPAAGVPAGAAGVPAGAARG
jgi:hypothetical protein